MSFIEKLKTLYKSHKKTLLIIFFMYILLLAFLLPYEDAIQKVILKTTQAYPNFSIQYQSSSLGFFPPRLTFKEAEIKAPLFPQGIVLNKLTLKPHYLALFALTWGARLEIEKEKSKLKFLFKNISSKKQPTAFSIQSSSSYFNLEYLNIFSSFFNNAKGVIEFFMKLDIDSSFDKQPEGVLELKGKNLEFQPYTISGFNLPLLKWKSFQTKLQASQGEIKINQLTLGTKQDLVYLDTKGEVNLSFQPISLREYEVRLDLILGKSLKEQFSLSTFLGNIDEQIAQNKFQYLVNIKGRSLYPPQIQNLKKKTN